MVQVPHAEEACYTKANLSRPQRSSVTGPRTSNSSLVFLKAAYKEHKCLVLSFPLLPYSCPPILFSSLLFLPPLLVTNMQKAFYISDDKEIYDHNNKIPDFQKLFETESGNQKMQLTAWDQRIYRRCSRLDNLVQFVAPVDRQIRAKAPPRHRVFGHFIQGSLNDGLTHRKVASAVRRAVASLIMHMTHGREAPH